MNERALQPSPGAEPDRRMFYLKTLYELLAELSPITDSHTLMNTFLLILMGAVGSAQGVMMVIDRNRQTVLTAIRGAEIQEKWTIEKAEKRLYLGFASAEDRRLAPMSVTPITDPSGVFPASETGMEVHTAFLLVIHDSLLGVVGLGAPLESRAVTDESRELLAGMCSGFMVFIKNVRAYETVQALNTDLNRTNEDLRRTIAELTEARNRIRVLEFAKIRLKQMVQQKIEQAGKLRWLDVLLTLAVSVILATLFNVSNPNGIPWIPETVLSEPSPRVEAGTLIRELLPRGNVILVDARPQELYQTGYIPDAVNIPAPLFDIIYPMKLGPVMDPDQTIVVYGRTISRHYDEEVARQLLQRHDKVQVMTGGISGWKRAGGSINP
jgi:rhodanese-related sulfurtransferase